METIKETYAKDQVINALIARGDAAVAELQVAVTDTKRVLSKENG